MNAHADDMHHRSITWREALRAWRAWLLAAGRPQTTVRLRLYQLTRFAELHSSPWAVTPADVVAWLAAQGWASETRRSYRAGLAGFYGWAVRAGHAAVDPTLDVPAAPPAHHLPRPAPEQAVRAGLEAGDVRVRLMVALAARQGLRRGEVARLRTDDVLASPGGWQLRVHGKGDRQRVIPLADDLAVQLRALPAGWVFPGQDGGHLSPAWVGRLVSRALPAGWTTHTLRHRFATVTYRGSRDLLAVQDLLGHSKPETTRLYVLPPDDGMRDALRWAA